MMVVTLGIGAFGSDALRAQVGSDGPGCPLRTATTLRCAFCGMTHATLALGHGDVREAFAHHPAAPFVLLFMFATCGAIVAGRGRALSRGARPWLLLGLVAAIWIVNWVGAGVT